MFKAAEDYCKEKTNNYDESHDWLHHKQVAKNVALIADDERIDPRIRNMLVMAAWLHDIIDHKYVKDINKEIIEMKSFLNRFYTTSESERIILWINNSSWSKEKKLGCLPVADDEQQYARILADADRLEAISGTEYNGSPVGIARCKAYSEMKRPDASPEEITADVKKHCEEKLLILHEWIFTKSAKKIAIANTAVIQSWYDSH